MKIVHVVEAWKGGVASYVEALIQDQCARGFSVTLLADMENLESDLRNLNVDVVCYSASRRPFHFFSISRKISSEIERLSPDVVHCHSTFPGVYVRLRRYTCKVIYTPHAWSFLKEDVNFIFKQLYKLVERSLSFRCEKIICMSLEELNAARTLGIPLAKLSLIYTGIPKAPCLSPSTVTFSADKLKVGFFGRFDYQKGFDLVESASELLSPDVELHLFGDAVRSNAGERFGNYIQHGWISHAEIHSYMSAMDVVLIPSRWEGFALTPLEAMRAGRPVVISNKSSLPEAVIHGFNGMVISDLSARGLAETLNSLSRNQCVRMGSNALVVFEQNFRFEDFSRKILDVYLATDVSE